MKPNKTAEEKLKIAISALDAIASDYEHMKRKDMIERAGIALCDIGAWRKVLPGEFARGGQIVALTKDKLTDGLGNEWSAWCSSCRQKTMEIVRPGKVQCSICG